MVVAIENKYRVKGVKGSRSVYVSYIPGGVLCRCCLTSVFCKREWLMCDQLYVYSVACKSGLFKSTCSDTDPSGPQG